MKPGYLAIETHTDHQGWIRLLLGDRQPALGTDPDASRRICYVARFNDGDAALMHTHEILKRRLLDLDARLYRANLAQGIAAIESLDLRHRQVYLDPDLSTEIRAEVDALAAHNRHRKQLRDRFFKTLGYIGLGLLLFNLFFLSFA